MAEPRKWTLYDAVAACEGFDGIEHDQETLVSAWQFLIDCGAVWTLQGWWGRQANDLIARGVCHAKSS